LSAFSLATLTPELTTIGGRPARTRSPSADPPPVFVIWRFFVPVAPLSELLALTVLVCPKLKIPPTPVPAKADADARTRTAAIPLRHTALTHEAAAGNPMAYVQLKAGHSQSAITERYIHAAQ